MEIVVNLLNEVPWFLAHMATAVALTLFYVVIYMWVTPHPEIKLIRENNMAASLAFSGSLIGFCIPFTSAIINSVSLIDVVAWGVVALLVQILIFYMACLYRLLFFILFACLFLKFQNASKKVKWPVVYGLVVHLWLVVS